MKQHIKTHRFERLSEKKQEKKKAVDNSEEDSK